MKFTRKFPVKILAGFVILKSANMANFLNKNVPIITVSQDMIDELNASASGGGKESAMEGKVPVIMERAGQL